MVADRETLHPLVENGDRQRDTSSSGRKWWQTERHFIHGLKMVPVAVTLSLKVTATVNLKVSAAVSFKVSAAVSYC